MPRAERGGRNRRAADIDPPADRPRNSRAGLAIGFSLVGLSIIILTSLSTRVNTIPATAEFGLFELLPPAYWVGLLLMGIAMALAIRGSSESVLAVTGTLFFAMFAATSVLFEPNPPLWDAYSHLATAQDIGLFARLPTIPEQYSANWPGFFLVVSFLSTAGAVPPLQLMSLIPVLSGGLTFLALFLFLRAILPPWAASMGSVLGSLLNVWAQFHLSPQSVGLILALLVLATAWRKSVHLRAVSAVLFVGLVVTHPTSTILVLSILVAHAILSRITLARKQADSGLPTHDPVFAHTPALAFGVVWLGWLFFQAAGSAQIAETAILMQMGNILQVPEQTINIATARAVQNIFVWPPLIRLGSLAACGALALPSLTVLWRDPRTRDLAVFLWATLGGIVLVAVTDILGFGGQFYDRSLMMFAALVPGITLAGLWTRGRKGRAGRAALAVLLVASVAAASTVYYQEVFYFVSDESVATSEFLQQTDRGTVVLGGFYPDAVWIDPADRIAREPLGLFTVYPKSFEDLQGHGALYAVFDPTSVVWYRQWYGINLYRFYEANRTNYALIYANGHTEVYYVPPPG